MRKAVWIFRLMLTTSLISAAAVGGGWKWEKFTLVG